MEDELDPGVEESHAQVFRAEATSIIEDELREKESGPSVLRLLETARQHGYAREAAKREVAALCTRSDVQAAWAEYGRHRSRRTPAPA